MKPDPPEKKEPHKQDLEKKQPPAPPRVTYWMVEGGTQFKISETEKGLLLELVYETSKLYKRIRIPLTRDGNKWTGVGDLYFRRSPDRRYDATVEIVGGDVFSSATIDVVTTCPEFDDPKKRTQDRATWRRKK